MRRTNALYQSAEKSITRIAVFSEHPHTVHQLLIPRRISHKSKSSRCSRMQRRNVPSCMVMRTLLSNFFPCNNAVYAFEKGRSFCRGELAIIPLCTPRSLFRRQRGCGRIHGTRFALLPLDDLTRCAPRKNLGLIVYGKLSLVGISLPLCAVPPAF